LIRFEDVAPEQERQDDDRSSYQDQMDRFHVRYALIRVEVQRQFQFSES
jgi:hypothetical protein